MEQEFPVLVFSKRFR